MKITKLIKHDISTYLIPIELYHQFGVFTIVIDIEDKRMLGGLVFMSMYTNSHEYRRSNKMVTFKKEWRKI